MELLTVKEICEKLDTISVMVNRLIAEMENKIIVGEINRPAPASKKIRKKRTPKVKGEAIPGPGTPQIEDKLTNYIAPLVAPKIEDRPRRERVRRIVKTPAPKSVLST